MFTKSYPVPFPTLKRRAKLEYGQFKTMSGEITVTSMCNRQLLPPHSSEMTFTFYYFNNADGDADQVLEEGVECDRLWFASTGTDEITVRPEDRVMVH
jgi:hypothetical protein